MKVHNLIPEVYYRESRDFAYIGRLAEVVFNYMKTVADSASASFKNSNIQTNIIDLLVESVGFDLKHSYADRDLIYIANTFSSISKIKGSEAAIDLAIRLMLNSQGIEDIEEFTFCNFDPDTCQLEINIPDNMTDVILLEDLFAYILPAGVIYKIAKFHAMDPNKKSDIKTISKLDDPMLNVNDDVIGIVKSGIADNSTYHIKDDYDEVNIPKTDDIVRDIGGFAIGVVVTDESDQIDASVI